MLFYLYFFNYLITLVFIIVTLLMCLRVLTIYRFNVILGFYLLLNLSVLFCYFVCVLAVRFKHTVLKNLIKTYLLIISCVLLLRLKRNLANFINICLYRSTIKWYINKSINYYNLVHRISITHVSNVNAL